jgi:hypothetical protein
LNFHLAGINNQNFIMRDEETGTWWQQVSGTAIQGPLKESSSFRFTTTKSPLRSGALRIPRPAF